MRCRGGSGCKVTLMQWSESGAWLTKDSGERQMEPIESRWWRTLGHLLDQWPVRRCWDRQEDRQHDHLVTSMVFGLDKHYTNTNTNTTTNRNTTSISRIFYPINDLYSTRYTQFCSHFHVWLYLVSGREIAGLTPRKLSIAAVVFYSIKRQYRWSRNKYKNGKRTAAALMTAGLGSAPESRNGEGGRIG